MEILFTSQDLLETYVRMKDIQETITISIGWAYGPNTDWDTGFWKKFFQKEVDSTYFKELEFELFTVESSIQSIPRQQHLWLDRASTTSHRKKYEP